MSWTWQKPEAELGELFLATEVSRKMTSVSPGVRGR